MPEREPTAKHLQRGVPPSATLSPAPQQLPSDRVPQRHLPYVSPYAPLPPAPPHANGMDLASSASAILSQAWMSNAMQPVPRSTDNLQFASLAPTTLSQSVSFPYNNGTNNTMPFAPYPTEQGTQRQSQLPLNTMLLPPRQTTQIAQRQSRLPRNTGGRKVPRVHATLPDSTTQARKAPRKGPVANRVASKVPRKRFTGSGSGGISKSARRAEKQPRSLTEFEAHSFELAPADQRLTTTDQQQPMQSDVQIDLFEPHNLPSYGFEQAALEEQSGNESDGPATPIYDQTKSETSQPLTLGAHANTISELYKPTPNTAHMPLNPQIRRRTEPRVEYNIPPQLEGVKRALGNDTWNEYMQLIEDWLQDKISDEEVDKKERRLYQMTHEPTRMMIRRMMAHRWSRSLEGRGLELTRDCRLVKTG